MSWGGATIQAECDNCGEVCDPINLTPLAGGGWDMRNAQRALERWGWRVQGDTHTCAECVDEEKKKAKA